MLNAVHEQYGMPLLLALGVLTTELADSCPSDVAWRGKSLIMGGYPRFNLVL